MSDKKTFRCLVCEGTNWENVDKFRIKPVDMSICKSCGFVSYPTLYKTKEEILDYYRNDYRGAPNISSHYTGLRKLKYHDHFLLKIFQSWKEKKNTRPFICDVGAAHGMFLNHVKQYAPTANLYGVELTKGFRRNAWHFYGINLTEDFDDSLQYDLISSYKCAEHILDVDKEMVRYSNALKPDGVLYISIPFWFTSMENSGVSGFDIEFYYHTNHINVWMKEHFEYLLRKAKLKVVMEDHTIYPSTYICQKDDTIELGELPKLYDSVMASLKKVHEAYIAYEHSDYNKAIEIFPNFPICHIARYEYMKKKYHEKGYDWIKENIIDKAVKSCPNNPDLFLFAADVCMRYDKIELAVEYLDSALKVLPGSEGIILKLSHAFRQMAKKTANAEDRNKFVTEARDSVMHLAKTSPQYFAEAMNWVYSDNANIPTPFEK